MIKNLEKTFKALSDSSRLRILKMLQIRSLCLCEIQEVLGLAGATVSKHLSILRDAGFLESEKRGTWVYFRLHHSTQKLFAKRMLSVLKQWLPEDEIIQKDIKKIKSMSADKTCNAGQ